MIYETGNRLLDRLERRFGGWALPRILRWIAGFQVLTFVLSLISSDFPGWIDYDRQAILSGEVWRLFTWVLHPASPNPIFVLFALMILFFINDGLESEWDSFRLNVFVFATIGAISLAGLLPVTEGAGFVFNTVFYSAVFLAFAALFPNQIIHLFAIIPVKAKWLGWLNAFSLAFFVMKSSHPLILGGVALAGLLPYLLTFVPGFFESYRRSSQVSVRRHQFEHDSLAVATFHECDRCGATEKTHPEREFRVAADGSEYCDSCRSSG